MDDINLEVWIPDGQAPNECEWTMLGDHFTREHFLFIDDATEAMFDDHEVECEVFYKVTLSYRSDSGTGPYGQGHYYISSITALPETSNE